MFNVAEHPQNNLVPVTMYIMAARNPGSLYFSLETKNKAECHVIEKPQRTKSSS